MNELELKRAYNFAANHDCPNTPPDFKFEEHPTSVGVAVYILCRGCTSKINITDYDS